MFTIYYDLWLFMFSLSFLLLIVFTGRDYDEIIIDLYFHVLWLVSTMIDCI